MRQHHDAVLGQLDVGLECLGANADGATECRHGVLWKFGFEAAVGNDLRPTPARRMLLSERKVGCMASLAGRFLSQARCAGCQLTDWELDVDVELCALGKSVEKTHHSYEGTDNWQEHGEGQLGVLLYWAWLGLGR